MQQPTLIILLLFSGFIHAQSKTIKGQILDGSTPIANVHVVNLNTENGAVTNEFGEYEIRVELNDVLFISSVQYIPQKIKITETHLSGGILNIQLFLRINVLDEVVLNKDTLVGNLASDMKLVKDSDSISRPIEQSILAFDLSKPVLLDADDLDHRRPPNADPFMGSNVPGGDLLGLVAFVLKPVIKEVAKIGKAKREAKAKERENQYRVTKLVDSLREDLGDEFFIRSLKLEPHQIDAYLNYCKNHGLSPLFLNQKKLEIIDFLLTHVEAYKLSEKE